MSNTVKYIIVAVVLWLIYAYMSKEDSMLTTVDANGGTPTLSANGGESKTPVTDGGDESVLVENSYKVVR
jgi:hypothetical protein